MVKTAHNCTCFPLLSPPLTYYSSQKYFFPDLSILRWKDSLSRQSCQNPCQYESSVKGNNLLMRIQFTGCLNVQKSNKWSPKLSSFLKMAENLPFPIIIIDKVSYNRWKTHLLCGLKLSLHLYKLSVVNNSHLDLTARFWILKTTPFWNIFNLSAVVIPYNSQIYAFTKGGHWREVALYLPIIFRGYNQPTPHFTILAFPEAILGLLPPIPFYSRVDWGTMEFSDLSRVAPKPSAIISIISWGQCKPTEN